MRKRRMAMILALVMLSIQPMAAVQASEAEDVILMEEEETAEAGSEETSDNLSEALVIDEVEVAENVTTETDSEKETDLQTESSMETEGQTENVPAETEGQTDSAAELSLEETGSTPATISIESVEEAEPASIEESGIMAADLDGSWQDGNITAVLEDGVLTLTGSGAMTDYTGSTYQNVPWYGYDIDKVVVSEGITHIGNYTFVYCTATEISLPSSLLTIGDYAYYANENLTSVSISASVTSIGKAAFAYSDTLGQITLDSALNEIGAFAFGCTAVKSLIIPDSVTTLGEEICGYCESLQSVTVGNGVEMIPYYTFYGCTALTTVSLGSRLTTIQAYAFYKCTSLGSLVIPDGVTCIEEGAFSGCTNLSLQLPAGLVAIEDGSYYQMETVSLTGTYYYEKAYEVLILVNKERTAAGLSELTMDQELLEAAMQRAAETSISFSHTRPSGLSCFTVSEKASGENIACGQTSASSVMNSWMNSSGHKANILGSSYQSIGIGCFSQGGTLYWVQIFDWDEADAASQKKNAEKTTTVALEPGAFASSLSLKASSTSLTLGNSITFYAYLGGAKLNASSLIWSSDSNVSVSSSGKVTAKKAGSATVTASSKLGTMSASATVKISVGSCKISSLTNTSGGIKLKWQKVSGASGYYIYRSTKSGKFSSKPIKTVTGDSTVTYTDTAVKNKNGTIYYYKVVPYSGSTEGTGTQAKTARLKAVALSSVKNSASKKITVKWKKTTKVTGYQIQYSKSKTFASGNKTVSVSGASKVSKVISKLTKNKTYYVRIRTYQKVSGKTYYSAWSSKKSVKIKK